MLTQAEKAEIRRADKYELNGPLTHEDFEYHKNINRQVSILLKNYNRIVVDEYTTGCHQGTRQKAGTHFEKRIKKSGLR